jgi:hypothetical protein
METLNDALLCYYGRSFLQPGRLKNHQMSCKKGKKRFTDAFEKARESWAQRKRKQVEDLAASYSGIGQNGLTTMTSNVSLSVEMARAQPKITFRLRFRS